MRCHYLNVQGAKKTPSVKDGVSNEKRSNLINSYTVLFNRAVEIINLNPDSVLSWEETRREWVNVITMF